MSSNEFTPETFFDVSTFSLREIFSEVSYVWEVLPKIKHFILREFEEKYSAGKYKNKNNIFIGEGTFVRKSAEIVGPAIIGKNCIIGHNAILRENCILGENVRIGHGVEVKNSIFLNNAIAAHLNYIGDSIIGNDVNISGGAMLANFRFDKQTISVRVSGKRINTGLQKFGAIVGDKSIIGVNAVINPGTLLGKECIVYPLVSINGVYAQGFVVR